MDKHLKPTIRYSVIVALLAAFCVGVWFNAISKRYYVQTERNYQGDVGYSFCFDSWTKTLYELDDQGNYIPAKKKRL